MGGYDKLTNLVSAPHIEDINIYLLGNLININDIEELHLKVTKGKLTWDLKLKELKPGLKKILKRNGFDIQKLEA